MNAKIFRLALLTMVIMLCPAYWAAAAGDGHAAPAAAPPMLLEDLIKEGLQNSPELKMYKAGAQAATHKIPQVKSLPDPVFMFGYQNEGWSRYTLGEFQGSQWIFSATQAFPFPGKLKLRGEAAGDEAQGAKSSFDSARLNLIAKIQELYYAVFLDYRDLDILKDNRTLLNRVEDAALARYSSGQGQQEEVLMVQSEKYMLLEKEQMAKQKLDEDLAAFASVLGRDSAEGLGRPADEPGRLPGVDKASVLAGLDASPELKMKKEIVEAARARLAIARREYYPDFSVTGSVYKRGGEFMDMWSLTTAVNVPIFYRTKQREGVEEAEAYLEQATDDLQAARNALASELAGSVSVLQSARTISDLDIQVLMAKTREDLEAALAGYVAGKIDETTVVSRFKVHIEHELTYWQQIVDGYKAASRIAAITGNNPIMVDQSIYQSGGN